VVITTLEASMALVLSLAVGDVVDIADYRIAVPVLGEIHL
jgi:hypothetical protein